MPNVQAQVIVNDALSEINALAQGETPGAGDASFALGRLNQIADAWNAQGDKIWGVDFQEYTLVPNLSPHTIGPSGGTPVPTFAMPAGTNNRPVTIKNAAININTTTPNVFVPLTVHAGKPGADWYAANSVPGIVTSIPVDVYYSPDEPNGSLYFWPIPNQNYGVRLEIWSAIATYANLAGKIQMPPGYQLALMRTLAEDLIAPFQVTDATLIAQVIRKAAMARAAIAIQNVRPLGINTLDSGIPSGRPSRPNYNWLNGSITY